MTAADLNSTTNASDKKSSISSSASPPVSKLPHVRGGGNVFFNNASLSKFTIDFEIIGLHHKRGFRLGGAE